MSNEVHQVSQPLRESQLAMARHLRNPDTEPAPAGVEHRRLKVYRELIYNNIEGFISGGFPVLRSLYDDLSWHQLVRQFIDGHRCHTPYFLEISQEFLRFLLEEYQPGDNDPPFLTELAHYEWVELGLDISEELAPQAPQTEIDIATAVPSLSPLAWVLSYRYPVHRIGTAFRPTEPGEPTYLVVYRDRDDQVQFMQLNAATARLLELVRDNPCGGETSAQLLSRLAGELGMPADAVLASGGEQLRQFAARSIVSF